MNLLYHGSTQRQAPDSRVHNFLRRGSLPLIFALVSWFSLSGFGCAGKNTAAPPGNGVHSVTLGWDPSPSVVVGYNVYRSTQSGGSYTRLNSSPLSGGTYTDSTVQVGQTYFYVATAVDSNNVESIFSNEVSATIPTP